MRIESCRKCGNEMVPTTKEELICQTCKEPGKFICSNCGIETEMRFHMHFDGEKAIHAPLPVLTVRK